MTIISLMQHLSSSEPDTAALASRLAPLLRAGDALCLRGALGMGKSVFARALIRALCNDAGLDVPSPTFTLVQMYETQTFPIWHFDLYRLDDPDEIYELGWEDARGDALSLIEWPERLGALIPADRLDIVFSPGPQEDARRIDYNSYGHWQERTLA
jgi:tRNA threonylcarbamoyl adenosine modification protein YjeE